MSEYPVNRGIGKPVEFKGLKSQYLFIFAGGSFHQSVRAVLGIEPESLPYEQQRSRHDETDT